MTSPTRRAAGLANLPLLFPDANVINPEYYGYWALNTGSPAAPYWDGNRVYKAPNFTWGNRITSNTVNGPPNVGLNNLREHPTLDLSVSFTKVFNRHTFKAGYYNNHSLKRESVSVFGTNFGTINFGNDTANPFDTSFGFANAAIGSFTEFQQGAEYIEGSYTFDNREFYVQDNWKATSKLTLDYGVRFVNATPLYDNLMQGGNFLPERFAMADAPAVYVYGCANGVYPCTGNNRQAMNPVTGQFLGPNTNAAVGTIVPGTGSGGNGLFAAGDGIAKTSYTFPTLVFGPRVGHGLRRHRHAASRRPRERRDLLRPPASGRRAGARGQHRRLGVGALLPVADARQRRVDHAGSTAAHGVSVRREAADRHGVERRHADDAALVDLVRRGLHRPAQLQRPGRRSGLPDQHQYHRHRARVPSGPAGSVAGGERHCRGIVARGTESQSGARLSRLRQHHLPSVPTAGGRSTRRSSR